jgi:serine/threonine-protein kinase
MENPQIENYIVLYKLGEGGFGTVYLAQHEFTKELFAIKFLQRADEEIQKRFSREIKLLSHLKDIPVIVDIFDYGYYGNLPYYVMEYCQQGSLRKSVGFSNLKMAMIVLNHISFALTNVHHHDGFHRDVKPDNILSTSHPDGSPLFKLSDFGLSRIADTSSTFTANPMGTFLYAAPEILKGHDYTDKSDIYSLGITMVELMTGKRDEKGLGLISGSANNRMIVEALKTLLQAMILESPAKRPTAHDVWERVDKLIVLSNKREDYHYKKVDIVNK